MKKVLIKCAHDRVVPLDEIEPNPLNPNVHPPEQIGLLAKIIRHQGWRNPIVVSKRSGFVVSGHGRLYAARELGLSHAPVDFQDFKTEKDELAHLIADNRIAELADLDQHLLKDLAEALQDSDFDSELAGFTADEWGALLAGAQPPEGFAELGEGIATDFKCPKCGYRWSGSPNPAKDDEDQDQEVRGPGEDGAA